MRYLIACFLLLLAGRQAMAQQPDKIYMPNINGVKLSLQSAQAGYPIITLGSTGALELHFDDLDAYVKNYSYTYQLCNADWTPVDLSPFDYIQGFTQNRISQYTASSIALTRYIHYQATLPERNCVPSKSGNYLLKVFLNGDTSQLAFCSRILVVDEQAGINAQIQQPFNFDLQKTSHKIQFTIDKAKLNIMNPEQQLKVVVLQNYRWDNAITGKQPQFMRGNSYEYNGERDFIFPAGKEYRWLDLRSFRFQSERIADVNMRVTPFDVIMKPDLERTQTRYLFYQDLNGFFQISSTEQINSFTQGDYGNVHFTYVANGRRPLNKDVYITGQFNGNVLNDSAKMVYNEEKGVYEKTLLLKQGYYTYMYATRGTENNPNGVDVSLTEGNYWETEDEYTILVYYRSLSNRYDELVGIKTVNSRTSRSY